MNKFEKDSKLKGSKFEKLSKDELIEKISLKNIFGGKRNGPISQLPWMLGGSSGPCKILPTCASRPGPKK